jgi:hypothetical protein
VRVNTRWKLLGLVALCVGLLGDRVNLPLAPLIGVGVWALMRGAWHDGADAARERRNTPGSSA